MWANAYPIDSRVVICRSTTCCPLQRRRLAVYMAEDYMQHNPNVPTGREPFIGFFGRMPQQEVKDTIDGLVAIMAEGDLVTMAFVRECADPRNAGQTYTTTWFDMFRVEDGKIAEHWDYGTVTGEGNPPDCMG